MTETANYSFFPRTKDYENGTLDPTRNLAIALKFKSVLGGDDQSASVLGRIRQKSH